MVSNGFPSLTNRIYLYFLIIIVLLDSESDDVECWALWKQSSRSIRVMVLMDYKESVGYH